MRELIKREIVEKSYLPSSLSFEDAIIAWERGSWPFHDPLAWKDVYELSKAIARRCELSHELRRRGLELCPTNFELSGMYVIRGIGSSTDVVDLVEEKKFFDKETKYLKFLYSFSIQDMKSLSRKWIDAGGNKHERLEISAAKAASIDDMTSELGIENALKVVPTKIRKIVKKYFVTSSKK